MAFTQQQQQVIDHDGHLLVVAGPGSGKTTTSVAKAQRILSDPARSLIMVTFTKEGAEEMRRRLDKAQTDAGHRPYPEDKLIIATFHSITIRHLHRHTPRRKVLSPMQQGVLLTDAIKSLGLTSEEEMQARQMFESYMYATDRSKLDLPGYVMEIIGIYLSRLQASGQTDLYHIMRDCAMKVDDGSIPPMPYTDMLVDEGQDTDDLQRMWIFAHAREGCNVTIVGDDDQSIYEWRQALGYQGMKSFMDTFSARRIELGDNFRCRSEILTHAVTLVERNKARLGKTLVAQRGNGGGITSIRTASSLFQANYLAKLIVATPEQHQNAAVLSRRNLSLDQLEIELRGEGIPYTRVGKSIWDNANVSGYISFLQTLLDSNPIGVLGVLSRLKMDEKLKTELLTAMQGDASSLLDGKIPEVNSMTPFDKKTLEDFTKNSRYWRTQLRTGSVLEVIIEVGSVYASWMKSPKTASLIELCAKVLSGMKGTLSARLRFLTEKNRDISAAKLVLMTMHGSKGLEFGTVHIIDANKDDASTVVPSFEAERRLMYVAITRAKNCCIAWYSGVPHQTIIEAEIPTANSYEDLVEMVQHSR